MFILDKQNLKRNLVQNICPTLNVHNRMGQHEAPSPTMNARLQGEESSTCQFPVVSSHQQTWQIFCYLRLRTLSSMATAFIGTVIQGRFPSAGEISPAQYAERAFWGHVEQRVKNTEKSNVS